jgi:hypothetical protein
MGWARGVAVSTAAGAGVSAVVLLRADLPPKFESRIPPKVRFTTAGGLGAVFGLGFGIVRPLLPRDPTAAGITYGVGWSMGVWQLSRAIGRAFGEPSADMPLLRLLLEGRTLAKIAEWAACGVPVALVEDAFRA